MNYFELKELMTSSRGKIANIFQKAYEIGIFSQKERDVMYYRHVDWNSLENCGKKFGVTRERIRQIEAKCEEKLRQTHCKECDSEEIIYHNEKVCSCKCNKNKITIPIPELPNESTRKRMKTNEQ